MFGLTGQRKPELHLGDGSFRLLTAVKRFLPTSGLM